MAVGHSIVHPTPPHPQYRVMCPGLNPPSTHLILDLSNISITQQRYPLTAPQAATPLGPYPAPPAHLWLDACSAASAVQPLPCDVAHHHAPGDGLQGAAAAAGPQRQVRAE